MSNDLRQRAQQLRGQLPERRQSRPPPEQGRRLATIPRPKDDEEIRINWCEYEGHPYLSVRFWKRGDDGQYWPDRAKGMSIRIRELPDVADAIAEALDLAKAHQRSRPQTGQGRQQARGDLSSKAAVNAAFRPAGNLPGMSAEPFDEFSEDRP